MLSIETSKSPGSLQKIEGASGELKGALGSWLQLIWALICIRPQAFSLSTWVCLNKLLTFTKSVCIIHCLYMTLHLNYWITWTSWLWTILLQLTQTEPWPSLWLLLLVSSVRLLIGFVFRCSSITFYLPTSLHLLIAVSMLAGEIRRGCMLCCVCYHHTMLQPAVH